MIVCTGKELLDAFRDARMKQSYDRIDYQTWKKYYIDAEISICCSGYDCEIGLSFPTKDNEIEWFSIRDNSLGQFVYNNFYRNTTNINISAATANITAAALDASTSLNTLVKAMENTRKENEKMNNNMFKKFNFGPCSPERVKMSPYGLATNNVDKEWVAYNAATGQIVNVDGFCFDIPNAFYKMPVALHQVQEGDMILHQNHICFVKKVSANDLQVIDITEGTNISVIPATNMFNFNFVTKIVSLFNLNGMAAPDANNPFGNILPMMMFSEMMGDKAESNDMGKMFMMASIFGGQNPFTQMFAGTPPTGNK